MFEFGPSIAAFHEEARTARRLEDFGEDDYGVALEVLCRSLDEDARLTEVGRFALRGMIVDALEARLLVEEGWKRHPECAEYRIERPIVIVGLPRTGTTALHHLLSQDPGLQALEHWLQRAPKPRPGRSEWEGDPDYRAAVERVRTIFERSPEMRAIHEIEAHLPDECWNLFAQCFAHSGYEANADVSGYAAWWSAFDMTPVYRRHLRNARLIGHREADRRWLFKDATHLFDLDALLEVYPDALIVQTHRDPVELIPSVCSLCWASRRALNEGTDPAEFGRSTLALWARSIRAMMAARARRDPKQFFDLPFTRFVSDPIGSIREIHAHFGLDLTSEAEAAIARFRSENPRGKHGEHRYTARQWGLDADSIAEAFREYTEAFGAAMEG